MAKDGYRENAVRLITQSWISMSHDFFVNVIQNPPPADEESLPTGAIEPLSLMEIPFSCFVVPMYMGMKNSPENNSFNPPAPHSWGDIREIWETPPNPRQRGSTPYGIPIFILHGAGTNTSLADSFENVILNEVKNISLREYDSLHLPRHQVTKQLPEEQLQGYSTPAWLPCPPFSGGIVKRDEGHLVRLESRQAQTPGTRLRQTAPLLERIVAASLALALREMSLWK